MMSRAVVNVATTAHYRRGQYRLKAAVAQLDPAASIVILDRDTMNAPSHSQVPYAFKAAALLNAANHGNDLLLWCDSSIIPIRSLEPLWARIERDGYWLSNNGWTNYEWTADSAYLDLFPEWFAAIGRGRPPLSDAEAWQAARAKNREIKHVVATAFGLNVRHPKGKAFLDEYYRLASETRAFCGPWINANHPDWLAQPGAQQRSMGNGRVAPCGPPDVRGHRHDQTAASVIAWRLGFQLTDPPEIFAYHDPLKPPDEHTILLAKGI